MTPTPRKYEAMDAYRIEQDDLPDGAFFQMAEDVHGWTADDWAWFADALAKKVRSGKLGDKSDSL